MVDVTGVFCACESDCVGKLEAANGRHIQTMNVDMGYNGFPYRNARLVKELENDTELQRLLDDEEKARAQNGGTENSFSEQRMKE